MRRSNARRCANSLYFPIVVAHCSAKRVMFLYFLNRFPLSLLLQIYIPELGMTFKVQRGKTRLFACQNPLNQGGGRKGLPKSFLNRFTQVYFKTGDYEGMYLVHEIFLCSREQKVRCVWLVRLRADGRNNSQQCWELLAKNVASVCTGLKVWPVLNFAQQHATTSINMQQGVQKKKTQHVTSNNVGSCWPKMLRPFARRLTHFTQQLLYLGDL